MTFEKWLKILATGGGAATVAMKPEEAEALNAGPLAKKFQAKFSSVMDKMPRMEIDDSAASIIGTPEWNKYYKLKDLLNHPQLYENYPHLAEARVHVGGMQGSKGSAEYYPFGTEDIIRTVEHGKNLDKETILHEVQHAIQEKEGFARGGSPSEFVQDEISMLRKRIFEIVEQYGKEEKFYPPAVVAEVRDLLNRNLKLSYAGDLDSYKRLAGEIESRDVAGRAPLTAEERLRTPHYSAQGIPAEDAIVRFRAGQQALQDPWLDPVSMFTAGVGIPRMAGKVAAAVADPVINYAVENMQQGNEDAADILIGRTPAERLERYRYKRR